MKKVIVFCLCFVFCFVGCGGQRNTDIEVLSDFEEYKDYKYLDIVKEFNGHIVFEDYELSDLISLSNLKDLTYTELSKIPKEIREDFINSNWVLYIGDETVNKYKDEFDYGIMGIAVYDEKLIAVKMPDKLLHEFGHYYQSAIGYMDNFEEYFETDKEIMESVSRYGIKDSHEFFATVFDSYIKDEIGYKNYITDGLKGNIDKTWAFFDNCKENHWYL